MNKRWQDNCWAGYEAFHCMVTVQLFDMIGYFDHMKFPLHFGAECNSRLDPRDTDLLSIVADS